MKYLVVARKGTSRNITIQQLSNVICLTYNSFSSKIGPPDPFVQNIPGSRRNDAETKAIRSE